jgi:hypothetical protein
MATSPVRLAFRALAIAAWAGVAALAAGCGGPAYGEVGGIITLNGKPLEKVEVVFLRDPDAGGRGERASGYTDPQGRYKLRTDRADRSGASVGSYRVIIRDVTARSGPPGRDRPERPPGVAPRAAQPARPSRVSESYSDPGGMPFTGVEVKPGNQTHNFDVGTGVRS